MFARNPEDSSGRCCDKWCSGGGGGGGGGLPTVLF